MYKQPIEYLRHILEECRFLLTATSDMTKERFMKDEVLKRATVRSLEIIGEACKKIPADVQQNWPAVSWKNMAGMRDRLIHDYAGINYTIVWDVVHNKIPDLEKQIGAVIDEQEGTMA